MSVVEISRDHTVTKFRYLTDRYRRANGSVSRIAGAAATVAFVLGWFCSRVMADSLFEQSLSISVAGAPAQLRIGSFSGNHPDLIVAAGTGRQKPTVTLLTNLGKGTVYSESGVQLSSDRALVQAIASADFNGDGHEDFAVAGDDLGVSPARTVVFVYLSSANGSLELAGQHTLNAVFPRCLEAADFDGNGGTDLAVCHSEPGGGGQVTLLSGDGQGAFSVSGAFSAGSASNAASVADVDQDGTADLLVIDSLQGKVRVFYGGATFGTAAAQASIASPVGVASLGGGRLLVVSGPVTTAVIFGSTGRSISEVGRETLSGVPLAALGADLDDDGVLEGAILTRNPDAVLVLEVDAEAAVVLRETATLGAEATAFGAADLGGDALADLVVTSEVADRVFLLVNDGADLPAPALCSPTPATACGSSTKSALKIRNSTDDTRDGFRWRWQSPGNEINSGDPINDRIVYAFCFYEKTADGSVRLVQSHTNSTTCSGAPCWKASSSGYRYSDAGRTFQGFGRLSMAVTKRDSMKIMLGGEGAALVLPEFPVAVGSDTIAQLVNDRGACWQTEFSAASSRSSRKFFVGKQQLPR